MRNWRSLTMYSSHQRWVAAIPWPNNSDVESHPLNAWTTWSCLQTVVPSFLCKLWMLTGVEVTSVALLVALLAPDNNQTSDMFSFKWQVTRTSISVSSPTTVVGDDTDILVLVTAIGPWCFDAFVRASLTQWRIYYWATWAMPPLWTEKKISHMANVQKNH